MLPFLICTEVAEYSLALRAVFEARYGVLTTQLQFKPVTIVPLSFQTLLMALKKKKSRNI